VIEDLANDVAAVPHLFDLARRLADYRHDFVLTRGDLQ